MADMIQLTVVRGCDASGNGGEVLDSPKVILADGTVNDILDAFSDPEGYGRLKVDNPSFDAEKAESEENPRQVEVSLARNFTYRVRLYVDDILNGWGVKQSRKLAEAASLAAMAEKRASVQVIE